MAGNYFGEAIASIYASGGASATTLNTGVAKMFTKYARYSGSVVKTKI